MLSLRSFTRIACRIAFGIVISHASLARAASSSSDQVAPSVDAIGTSSATDLLDLDSPPPVARTATLPSPAVSVSRTLASSDIESKNNSGWRMGAVYLDGERVGEIQDDLNMGRVVSAWGYQFQFEHGQAGGTSGLVDIVPMILGLDESMLIPTVNVLVGLRINSFEFGLGPHISPRAPALDAYFTDEVHVEGLGLCAAAGYSHRTPGGMNISVNLSAMWAGDLAAYGITFGWNMPK